MAYDPRFDVAPVVTRIARSIAFAERNGRQLTEVLVGRAEWAEIQAIRPAGVDRAEIYGVPVRPLEVQPCR